MVSYNADSTPVPRANAGKTLLLIGLAAVLVVTIPVGVWVYRSRQYAADKKVLDEQIARIRAAGDPLTLSELNASYRIRRARPT